MLFVFYVKKCVQAEVTTEKDGGGSQTSESSLESSSGYGSQTTLPHSQSGQNQNPESNSNTWTGGAPPTCILSRRGSMQQTTRPPPPTRRTSAIIGGTYSVSSVGLSSGVIGAGGHPNVGGGIVTGAVGAGNPSEDSSEIGVVPGCLDETENLPPPPAFLLEGSSPTLSPTPQR